MATETAEGESLAEGGEARLRVLATIGARRDETGATPEGAWRPCADEPVVGRSTRAADLVVRDRRMSSRHARIRRVGAGWEALDLGSKNGTRVAGRLVRASPVRQGTILRLGDTLLRVEPPSAFASPVAAVETRVREWAEAGRACAIQASQQTVAAVGECYHRTRGPAGALVIVDASGEVTVDGRSAEATGVEAWLDLADAGTLVVCAATGLPDAEVARLRAAYDANRSLVVGHDGSQGLPLDIELPPLHARPDDILRAVRIHELEVSAGFADGLVNHRWPGEDRELAAALDVLPRDRRLRRSELPRAVRDALATMLGSDDDADERPERLARWTARVDPDAAALVVDAEGGWLRPPGGPWVDVRRKPTQLAAVVLFAELRASEPGARLDTHAIFDALWPEAGGLTAATQNRVYKKLSLVRKLGLGDLLTHEESGYALDPDTPLVYIAASE